jgi:hypothetical protein
LLSPDAIANIIADYKAFGDKLKVEFDRVKAEEDANKRFELGNLTATCEADKKIIRAEADDAERRNAILVQEQKRLEKSEKSVKTWTLLGLAAGVLVGSLSFYGVSSLVK